MSRIGPVAPTRFGFVLDQRSCIGCHACTVACTQEHGVESGVFRAWVKRIEQGTFPGTRRYCSVLRCNDCDDAPCVSACPVTALYRREVDPDPISGMHCRHQKVRVRPAARAGRHADIHADVARARAAYRTDAAHVAEAVDWDPAQVWGPMQPRQQPLMAPEPAASRR